MTDNTNSPKTLEQLETEIVDLKIRLKRVEDYVRQIPSPIDYIPDPIDDDLIEEATKVVCQYDAVSASLLQRRLSIGYARAEKIMNILETKGIVGSSDGSSKPIKVLK
jgi:S-DNA-T family DNA segregation ATPase FtsK/SpoIIIE